MRSISNSLLTVSFTHITNSVPNPVGFMQPSRRWQEREKSREGMNGEAFVWRDKEIASEGALYPCKVETSLKRLTPDFISRRIMLSSSR